MTESKAKELVRRVMDLTSHVVEVTGRSPMREGDDHLIAGDDELADEAVDMLKEYGIVVADDSKRLETVEEHNDRISKERVAMALALQLTGVACPQCGKELEWQNQWPGGSWTWPEPKAAWCKDCQLILELAR